MMPEPTWKRAFGMRRWGGRSTKVVASDWNEEGVFTMF
jgi:hypothetical protein